VERHEIDMFGGDELVARLRSQVFDIVDEEGVGERLLDEEDDLGATCCEPFYDFSAYTGRSSL
jgi:hypothetical protein